MKKSLRRRAGAAIITTGLGAALISSIAGVASAEPSVATGPVPAASHGREFSIPPQGQAVLPTWFLGRTNVCVDDTATSGGGTQYHWWSFTSGQDRTVGANGEDCFTRAFVGIPVGIHNYSTTDTLVAYETGGPA